MQIERACERNLCMQIEKMRGCNRLHAKALSTALAAAVLLLAARTQQAGCPDGFSGVGCRECIRQCNMLKTCSGKGRCRGTDGKCICDEVWTEAACSIRTSVTTPPPTMGCPDGFSGVGFRACEEDTYSGGYDKQFNEHKTCSGNGRCRGSDGTCICDEGWTGAVCSIPTSVTTPPQSTGCPDGFSGVGFQACEGDTYSGGCDKQCDEHTTCSSRVHVLLVLGTCSCILFSVCSFILVGPLNSLVWWEVYSFGLIFVSARTNKRHHHVKGIYLFHTLYYKQ